MKKTPTLETERLLLRTLKVSDAESIYLYFSEEEMLRYYGMEPFANIIEAEKFVKDFLDDYKLIYRWGIVEKGSYELIGTCGFHAISENHKRAEIGYEIAKPFWGKGYATEAVSRLVQYGFEEFQWNRIGANVYPNNKGSQRVLEKLGFTHEGRLRGYIQQGKIAHDTNVFSILKDEFHQKKN
ncbi:GNAT family N-acetyltransferase [Sutcliffiella cohnii]|uniref:GNAT family N-acetyltransferase n=1 Tax=Sutcliffiella cohnii TaxID=33932 RepID=A0A223KQF7_9BACI|nr:MULTISPECIES: GNAT family N-acetyltransferase [Sutcliffiella]AST91563.1 GNAT family N-acetyltransferase [Sutcliffiella cohnii]MED4014864.1 GNAT family N-acetyltransferase [Sutcliffiella cohnii]WBL17394.1 GNAT family N-acetyltransferase [Sutcliffiella sp. NC1]